jgi:mycothiol synthase
MATLTSPSTFTLALPAGYSVRPATLADVESTVAMLNAASQALAGEDQHAVADWQSDWQAPGFDLAEHSRLILAPDSTVAGFALLWASAPFKHMEQWGRVHPAHTGRGLGTYLTSWSEAAARRAAASAPAGEPSTLQAWANRRDLAAQALLADQGFALVRHFWRMAIAFDDATPPAIPQWPEGVHARAFVPGQDDEATYRAYTAAFRESWGFVERPFDEGLAQWRHYWHNAPDFDPGRWFLAVTGEGAAERIVGTSFCRWSLPEDPACAWIHTLGVLRDWRRQGIAEALLRQCFVKLYQQGRRKVALGVDAANATGATRLYERAGMRAVEEKTETVWEKLI